MLRVLSHADTDLLAIARALGDLPAGFPEVRVANPASLDGLDAVLDGARIVVVRLLGGRRAWEDGVEELRRRASAGDGTGFALLLLGGEPQPDAELAELSHAPAGALAQAFEYLRHGGVPNATNMLRFLADTFLLEGYGFEAPVELPSHGSYEPALGPPPASRDDSISYSEIQSSLDATGSAGSAGSARSAGSAGSAGSAPRVGIVFYRSHLAAGNTAFVDALAQAVVDAGGIPTCVWAQSLRPDAEGRVALLEALDGEVDALVVTVLASGGSTVADSDPTAASGWRADALAALGVPVIQAVCVTRSRAAWDESPSGLSPMDVAMQVAIPEFDGRLLGGVVSFKEPHGAFDGVSLYAADAERCASVAQLTVRIAKLRTTPPERRKVVVMLSSFPTKHARIGNAVGLDTPASAIALLEALRDAGYAVDDVAADGDALIHGLIAAGGYDPDHLTDAQLGAAVARLPVERYERWFAELPEALRSSIVDTWGPPPGTQWRDGDDLVLAGLDLGGVFVAIQPPRGYGEDSGAIYHDPELAPSHHYLASYWWLDRVWGADALVHLGKHGTLEWLPGKSVGSSAACAPDAVLGTLPVIYPFVVNDPGEGVQAKRRVHATIVDHLIAPMARAGTHDELALLEDLLDEYARMEALDPSKLPALGARIWESLLEANLHHDLGLDGGAAPAGDGAIGTVIEHLDTYLCEVKDLQVRDGLHILGAAPVGEPLRNLVAAIMRLPNADVPALRRAIGAARGIDELALIESGARRKLAGDEGPSGVRGAREELDRLDAAQDMVLDALSARGWSSADVPDVARNVLGTEDPAVLAALRFACDELVPRLRASTGEMDAVLTALDGRYVPAGPSGSPTRGRVDVLPTGRNFYGVDPKALPSQLSWDVGVRLGDALLARHVEEDGRHPETVGIVVWGTAAMRTHGDDVAEILHLLGVRPVWDPDTRRVTGTEVVSLEELGRPRIDVVVRISGFFRDAFPHLVTLIDDAVTTVAALDESDDDNFLRKHVRADADRLAEEFPPTHPPTHPSGSWRRCTARVFGSAPGSYGAGLLELIDARNWRDDADLAAVYEAWGGYAYGAGLDGTEARGAVRDCFARIEVAVKNIDNREHDLFDSDGYFQYHGGMVAAVRALSGRDPKAWVGDSADPARVRALSLAEEARRVFRSRVTNPRWIGAMARHGYKGAFELAATVDYLFGYDATTGVVDDWMYEAVAEKYVRDPDVGAFLRRSNPWALHAMAERLLEAAERGLWAEPSPETLDALRGELLDVEAQLEEAGEPA
ncbi:MAG TPA: cobaltochelatase subunit CobN [Baekduia sp.]|uniref:cobaltochelatase subunit CobN n=1 Tax=Baekduia sp. TaxID=2600305 RepID=UPI002CB58128|nr:cobaltochelatase subunit CobN [Baekduia sp.]HMJ33438.1 cobaltochelatase subunit CobN [Baekduia sp.]